MLGLLADTSRVLEIPEKKPSFFSNVEMAPDLENVASYIAYTNDKFEKKIYLGSGTYRTEDDKPWVLPVVRTVEKILSNDESLTKEYLPILGLYSFHSAAIDLLLGSDSPAILENRCFGIQCLSGTGALRTASEFFARYLKKKIVYCSNPTWENHPRIFEAAGFEKCRKYRYFNPVTRLLDFDGLIEDLENAERESVILLQVCAHNPTGIDPTPEQWQKIAYVMKERNLFPFFDSAYQGFASGNLVKDAYAPRLFVSLGFELFVAQSFAKNVGLYCERVGNLTVVVKYQDLVPRIKYLMAAIRRVFCSHPPDHGARIVAYILNNRDMYTQWVENIKTMATKTIEIRKLLREALEQLETPGDWSHITKHVGLYSYTGLNEEQVDNMIKKHHVYMMKSGRITVSLINTNNVHYIADAIYDSVTSLPARRKCSKFSV